MLIQTSTYFKTEGKILAKSGVDVFKLDYGGLN